ncbi:hypothetical protein CEXT_98491 [Caerostris extrusa]|uniref:Uncharacterized protein n=1 Tax=Caerostris extrusa TaxID=172846 RepID=A0AAV4N0Z0_CAEEX|nr:hypothetical protein CEXT_98491 [Caerostris extrusa]
MIKLLTQEVIQCPAKEFVVSKRTEFMKRKSRIDDILDRIQDIFSFPTFAIVGSNLLNCFCVLNSYLDKNMWMSGGTSVMIECTLLHHQFFRMLDSCVLVGRGYTNGRV